MSPSRTKSGSAGARPSNRSLAPADKLKREIQAALTDELRSQEQRLGHGRYDGFAYPAAEAYFHLAGGHDADLHPMHLKHCGRSHWWLLDPSGRVIDLTLGPRETSDFPYHRGRRRPFRYTPAGISRRAQAIVERLKSHNRKRVPSVEAGPAAESSPSTGKPPTARFAPRGARWGLLG